MPPSVLSAFLAFVFISAFTPGPNNILSLSTGTRYGFKGSIPLLAGICCGFFCTMFICGALTFSLSTLSMTVIRVIKYIGCLYILWLAWKIATAKPESDSSPNTSAGFITGLILQFVNIKIIVYGITAYSGFILPYYNSIVAVLVGMCILAFVGSAGTVVWALAGSMMQRFFSRHARLMNTIMALMLLGCAISLILN